jgi:hypothetical protein
VWPRGRSPFKKVGLIILGVAFAFTVYVFDSHLDKIASRKRTNATASQKDGMNNALAQDVSFEPEGSPAPQVGSGRDQKTKQAQPVITASGPVAKSSATADSLSPVEVPNASESNIEADAASGSSPSAAPRERPRAWHVNPPSEEYGCQLETDHTYVKSGASSAVLRLTNTQPTAVCGMIQAAAANPFRGKRVEFSAYLATQNVTISALWFRAEDAHGRVIAFDNQAHSPMKGSFPWTADVIVIDVPESAAVIIYGTHFFTSGTMWVDAMEFHIVDQSVPLTAVPTRSTAVNAPADLVHLKPAPENLDFEELVPIDR